MKATKLAMFFDEIRRQEIVFDVNTMEGSCFNAMFGAQGKNDVYQERYGTFWSSMFYLTL